METVKRHVNIPRSRRLLVDIVLPDNIPVGSADIVIVINPVGEQISPPFDFPVDCLGQWPSTLSMSRNELYGDTEN